MIVSVTQQDIAKGRVMNADFCPTALAIRRKGATGVSVCKDEITFILHGTRLTVIAPAKVRQFIERFDSNRPVKPFKFTIKIP